MPTTVLEAMAAGCSVVGSTVDGIPDIIRHSENGWLSRPKDPEDLSRSILTALDDAGREPSIHDAALETARRHSWANVAARYAAEFELLGSAGDR